MIEAVQTFTEHLFISRLSYILHDHNNTVA